MPCSPRACFRAVLLPAAIGFTAAPFSVPEVAGQARAVTTAPTAARATLGTLELPSYHEGLPDPNPPFDAFNPARINYPYTLRTNLTNDHSIRAWRAVFLENEYLRCAVLPDLGGHLYSCTDKISGTEMFYANPSIKLTQIGYRGAWAAFGVEFNYPVSHNWMSASPVDFAYREHTDGSASVWVGNIDRVYGTDWRVELKLQPGQAVLEQHTTLYNRSNVRHRYYWWTNAAVRVTDESQVLYPMRNTASHGFTDIDTWPIDRSGTDNSRVGNHLFGPVSRFSHGSREAFMAVYHPDLETGVMHYSAPDHLPSKKIWSWGGDERGLDWRRALSDDSSAYVEIQAGVFRNQETYGFLEPQEVLRFSEYWAPLRKLGGLSRANPDVQLHMCRTDACGTLPSPGLLHAGEGTLRVRANVVRLLRAARLVVKRGTEVIVDERIDLDPWTTLDRTFDGISGPDPYTVEVIANDGRMLILHTEGQYQYADPSEIMEGPQASWALPEAGDRSESDVLYWIDDLERNGRRIEAWSYAQDGVDRFPESLALAKVAGRLAVVLRRFEEGQAYLAQVVARVSNDAEAAYYLGLAHNGAGDAIAAQSAWESALHDTRFRAAARVQLGLVTSAGKLPRASGAADAVEHFRAALDAQPRSPRVLALLAAALRTADQEGAALVVLDRGLADFPSHSFLRHEATLLGANDPSLASHFAGDPERVLEIAAEYLNLGFDDDVIDLLNREWQVTEGPVREPGQAGPQAYPLLDYFLAYAQARAGQPYEHTLQRAAQLPVRGVFPNRVESRRVLEWVREQDGTDANASWFLGALELQSARHEQTRDLWEEARTLAPDIPALHRSLGMLLMEMGDLPQAVAVLREGVTADPFNVGVYASLDDALERVGEPVGDRADALLQFPDLTTMPAALVYRTARRLSEASRFDEAEALFADRFFPREEGGINVRQVYLEVKVARARARAIAGACTEARQIITTLLDADPALEFTSDGLELWLDRANLAPEVEAVMGRCPSLESR